MTTPMPPAQTPPVPRPTPSASPVTSPTPAPAPATSGTTTSTSQPKEPTQQQDAPPPGGGVPYILLAAALTGLVAILLARAKTKNEARERSRLLFAEAYQWYAAYKEFPYAVRRRRTTPRETAAAEERVRLSEAMREVQSKLDYFRVWTALEDPAAGAAYATLLKQCRIVAGGSIREAWREPGTSRDADMNIPPERVLRAQEPYEDAYQAAVADALARRWWRRRTTPPDDGPEKAPSRPPKTASARGTPEAPSEDQPSDRQAAPTATQPDEDA